MRPKIQLALDVKSLDEVIEVCDKVKDYVEIIEAGTLLCLSEGMASVKMLKERFPEKEILADIRVIKAGKVLSELAYNSGADIITLIDESTDETLDSVFKLSKEKNKKIQIEINEKINKDKLKKWKKLGINELIIHRMSELTDVTKNESVKVEDLLKELTNEGFSIMITGGVKPEEVKDFKNFNIAGFIIGRSITKAEDPIIEAKKFQEEITKHFK